MPATVVAGVKVGVLSVSGGEDLGARRSVTAPGLRLRGREVVRVMVRVVGTQEMVWRGAVHHVWRGMRPGGQGTTARRRGDHVGSRVAVHLKYSIEISQSVRSAQSSPLSLVEVQRGSSLIGRELHSVAPPVSLMP